MGRDTRDMHLNVNNYSDDESYEQVNHKFKIISLNKSRLVKDMIPVDYKFVCVVFIK